MCIVGTTLRNNIVENRKSVLSIGINIFIGVLYKSDIDRLWVVIVGVVDIIFRDIIVNSILVFVT